MAKVCTETMQSGQVGWHQGLHGWRPSSKTLPTSGGLCWRNAQGRACAVPLLVPILPVCQPATAPRRGVLQSLGLHAPRKQESGATGGEQPDINHV